MSEVIGKNESPVICVWCVHKWHYKDFEELDKGFQADEFGLQTMITFYPSGVWLTNNADNTKELTEKGIEWEKQNTYSEFFKMLKDGSITKEGLYDWEEAGLKFEGKLPDYVQQFLQKECDELDLLEKEKS